MRLLANLGSAKDYLITAFLLTVSVGMMVARFDGGLNQLRSISVVIVSVLEQPLSAVRVYRSALATNRELRRQNVLLQDELSRLRSLAAENRELRGLLGLRAAPGLEFDMVPATVVGKNLTGILNHLTIRFEPGSGVQEGMPVVNSRGLLGRVTLVRGGYAHVIPLYNSLFRVSAVVEGTRAYGIVSWEGDRMDELVLAYVPQTAVVDTGMTVATSGFSNHLPPGIPLGTVTRINPEPGRETQRIYLRPAADLNSAAEAFVILFRPDAVVDSLSRAMEGNRP